MNALQRIPLLTLALAAPLACASNDDEPEIDVRDAQVGWHATGEVLALAHAQLDASEHDGSLVVECPAGGTSSVARVVGGVGNFEFDASFDGCTIDDITIDGAITVRTAVAIDEHGTGNDGSIAILIEYDGHLELAGSIAGACIVDAELRGGAVRLDGHASTGARVDGTLCGHAADVVVGGPE
jgi:hypothetical protein